MPLTVPGDALSPGARICSFVNAPALTVRDGEVEFWIDGWVTSEAVSVAVPAVFKVVLNTLVPLTRAALAGRAALGSLEVIATVSLILTTFQFASTPFTVRLKAVPAVSAVGVPVLPVVVPAAAVSPGVKICS